MPVAAKQFVIGILDDEPDRTRAMTPLLSRRFAEQPVAVFDNAPDMISWLTTHLDDVCLLSLDHDLGPNWFRDGAVFDPGIGRDVANFLATRSPQCHVIVHTTNHLAAPGMIGVLEESGWTVSQVVPYGDLEWIGEAWIREARRAIETFLASNR